MCIARIRLYDNRIPTKNIRMHIIHMQWYNKVKIFKGLPKKKPFEIPWIIFLPLNLITGQLT
jgi:hypothetical protein